MKVDVYSFQWDFEKGLTVDILNQNLTGAGAGIRLANVIDCDYPEAVAFELTEAGHSELSGGVQVLGIVDTHPV